MRHIKKWLVTLALLAASATPSAAQPATTQVPSSLLNSGPLQNLAAATNKAESFLVQTALGIYEWVTGVVEEPSVAALRANAVPWPTIHVQSWLAGSAKGGGDFEYIASDGASSDNSCTIFVDASGHRYYRNQQGDLTAYQCGAAGNGVLVASSSVSIASGQHTLTITGASFTAGDVGKTIAVPGAGTAGTGLITTISARTSATQVTLTVAAGTTLSAVVENVVYGTNDTAALQAWLNYANASGKRLKLTEGNYLSAALTYRWAQNPLVIDGSGGESFIGATNNVGSEIFVAAASGTELTLSASDQRVYIDIERVGFYNASGNALKAIAISDIAPGVVYFNRDYFTGFSAGSTDAAIDLTGNPASYNTLANSVYIEECQFELDNWGVFAPYAGVAEIWIIGNTFINGTKNEGPEIYFQKPVSSSNTDAYPQIYIERNTILSGDSQMQPDIVFGSGAQAITILGNYFEGAVNHPNISFLKTGNVHNGLTILSNTFNGSYGKGGMVVNLANVTGAWLRHNSYVDPNGGSGGTGVVFAALNGSTTKYTVEAPAILQAHSNGAVPPLGYTTSGPSCANSTCFDESMNGAAGVSVVWGGGATTICPVSVSMILVYGYNRAAQFTDLVLVQAGGTATVVGSNVSGSPPTRTYTVSGTNLQLALSGSTSISLVYTTNISIGGVN